MESIKEIFNSLSEDQVLLIYLDDDCKAVMTTNDKVESIMGTEFAIISCGNEKLPVPVEMIVKVEVLDKLDFVMRSIVEMAEELP